MRWRRRGEKGFTLLELLVVVIIVGILATVALPQFGRMIRRSRAAEGRNMVGAVLTAELVYYQERATFTSVLTDLLLDLPAESVNEFWDYAVSSATATQVVVTGTGEVGSPVDGIVVTGTMLNDGTRQVGDNL